MRLLTCDLFSWRDTTLWQYNHRHYSEVSQFQQTENFSFFWPGQSTATSQTIRNTSATVYTSLWVFVGETPVPEAYWHHSRKPPSSTPLWSNCYTLYQRLIRISRSLLYLFTLFLSTKHEPCRCVARYCWKCAVAQLFEKASVIFLMDGLLWHMVVLFNYACCEIWPCMAFCPQNKRHGQFQIGLQVISKM